MRIMVTGTTGFIGGHVAFALADAGNEVFCFKRTHPHFYKSDLIVHCAAAAGPWHTLEDIWRDNIDLTRRLIDFARPTHTPIIFTSSIMVHGESAEGVINEKTPIYSGASYYARSKHMCEYMLQMSGLDYVALRLPGVVGPDANLRNWLPNTARLLAQGQPVTIYGPKANFNNAVHTSDLCNFIVHLVKEGFEAEATYALGAGSILTVEQVVNLLATCLKVHHPVINTTPPIKPQFMIDSYRAQKAGYRPMTLPEIIKKFACDYLEIRAQHDFDF